MIYDAIIYVVMHGSTDDVKNDAANIYARSYEEYLEVWDAIKSV